MQIISASINGNVIPEEKIKRTDKYGVPYANGNWFTDIQIFIYDEPDKYGNNVSIVVGQTKEERELKAQKIYLGKGKVVWNKPLPEKEEPKQESESSNQNEDNSLPF